MSDRLSRLYPGLTAHERAMLVLRAHKDGRKEDPAVRSTMPYGQGREFDRLVRLINAVNSELAYAVYILRERVAHLATRCDWLVTLAMAQDDAALLARHLTPAAQSRARPLVEAARPWRLPFDLTLPLDREATTGPGANAELARMLVLAVRNGAVAAWQELRCIEEAVAEVAQEFEGEDPLAPGLRAQVDGAKALLEELRDSIAPYAPFDLPKPDAAGIELVRRVIARAVNTL